MIEGTEPLPTADSLPVAQLAMPEYHRRSVLERLDPRLKLVTILCASALAVALDTLWGLLLFCGLCLLPIGLARLPREQVRPLALLLLLATWGSAFSQGLFYDVLPRTPLLTLLPTFELLGLELGPLALYQEGLRHGVVQSLRFNALILLGTSVVLTTSPERLFLGLNRLRVPFGISFMAVTAVRFLPLMLEELRTVQKVRRLRGYRPFRRGLRETLGAELGVLRPVVVKALRKANELATSLSLRAFDPLGTRSSLHSLSFSMAERAALVFILAATSSILLLKGLYVLYLYGIWYIPALRPVYGWVRALL